MVSNDLSGHVAIVTGANSGIGAATAVALARRGAAVLVTYLRMNEEPGPAVPETYRALRARDAMAVIDAITSAGGRAVAIEADLSDAAPARLFDAAEAGGHPDQQRQRLAAGHLQRGRCGHARPGDAAGDRCDHRCQLRR